MHVLARLSGHGVVVLPHPSYRLQRVAGGPETTLRVSRGEATGVVDVLAALQTKSALVDVSEGGGEGPWRIETGIFTCPWPRGFDLTGDDASPFLLWGPGDALIWVDGPVPEERTTPLDKLVGPGQRIRATVQGDDRRVDVDYAIEGVSWWQRRHALAWGKERTLVVTAQSRTTDEAVTLAAVDEVASEILPYVPRD